MQRSDSLYHAQFNHFELSAHSLVRTLMDPLRGMLPPWADGDSAAVPAAAVSLNAPRSFLSDDGIVHLFSALVMHACLGTHCAQPHGGEFSVRADANAALLHASAPVFYDESYCVQAQLLTRALAGDAGPVVERLMRGKWHAKIGLAKILDAGAGGKSRIDLVTERMFDDAAWLASAGIRGAAGRVHVIAANKTYTLAQDDGGGAASDWVDRSRQMEPGGGHLSAAAGVSNAAPRQGYPGVYPDPLAQQMCVLAPPIARREIMAALKRFLRDFLAHDLAHMPDACNLFSLEVLPVLHAACNAPRGAFRVAPAATEEPPIGMADCDERDRSAIVFGASAWARATISLMRAYAAALPRSDARRSVVHANRLSWLLGTLAFLNASVADDWGAAHQRMDAYFAAFRAEYLATFAKPLR